MKIREIARGLQFPEGPVAMADGSVLLVEIARGTLEPRAARRPRAGRRAISAAGRTARRSARTARSTSATTAASAGPPSRRQLSAGRPGRRLLGRPHRAGRPRDRSLRAPVRQRRRAPAARPERHRLRCRRRLLLHRPRQGPRERDATAAASTTRRPTAATAEVIARPVMTPNGIGLSPDGNTLYYAETEAARLWAFDIAAPGEVRREAWPSPHGGRMVSRRPAATTSASTRWRSTRSATSASRR